LLSNADSAAANHRLISIFGVLGIVGFEFKGWRGRDGNDPSVDIAKDSDQRF